MLEKILRRYPIVAGVDEAGRGPLAGPVVAGCVLLTLNQYAFFQQLQAKDSKKLSESRREQLFEDLEQSFDCTVGLASVETIDRINILQASFLAMKRAIGALKPKPDLLIIDGKFPIPNLSIKQYCLEKADDKIPLVSAASIMAKVTRDRLMRKLGEKYPDYGFERHKGYGTRQHLIALRRLGACPIHRKSFSRVKDLRDSGKR
ncbi:MAG: ribonuclease HII [Candidatus Moranbacteria bacterium]|nr:ribonuclease HII [Candidatus Moranbacteria bacterium]